jgi:hypothetical protein
VNGHSFKLQFYMFERSQGKHNNSNCHDFKEYFPLIANFTCSKLDTNQKRFCMLKTLKPREWTIFFFSNVLLSTKCAPLFFLIGENFNIDE